MLTNISLVEDGYLADDGSSFIVGLQFLPDQTSVCVATSKGDLLLCNVVTNEVRYRPNGEGLLEG